MKEFDVRLIVKEYYTCCVEAEDEEQAEAIALEWLASGHLDMDDCRMETDITEVPECDE